MSTEVKLRAEKRMEKGKGAARKLRAQGRVPAVLYGKESEAVSLSIEAHEARMLFQQISVENTIIGLDIDGEKTPVQTLIREIQAHPYKPFLYHVDFYLIRAGETLEVQIPVHVIGVPEGVRLSGGILQQSIHEVQVRCLPTQIPDSIDIDVSHLTVGQSLHISDLNAGEGVEILLDPEQVVCSVVLPKVAAPAAEGAVAEAGATPPEGGEAGEE